MSSHDTESIQTIFQRIWGYDSFRFPQQEIIETILAAKDALIVMSHGIW
jgi:ATP-dependent DNA helicase RecQ